MQQLFRLWLGVTEYLFRKPHLLDEVIATAIEDHSFRHDDLEFTFAARVSSYKLLPNYLVLTLRTRHGPSVYHLATFNPTVTDLSGYRSTSAQGFQRRQGSATK